MPPRLAHTRYRVHFRRAKPAATCPFYASLSAAAAAASAVALLAFARSLSPKESSKEREKGRAKAGKRAKSGAFSSSRFERARVLVKRVVIFNVALAAMAVVARFAKRVVAGLLLNRFSASFCASLQRTLHSLSLCCVHFPLLALRSLDRYYVAAARRLVSRMNGRTKPALHCGRV